MLENFLQNLIGGVEDFHRIVLYITRLRIDLGELGLGHSKHLPFAIKKHSPRARGALVN